MSLWEAQKIKLRTKLKFSNNFKKIEKEGFRRRERNKLQPKFKELLDNGNRIQFF